MTVTFRALTVNKNLRKETVSGSTALSVFIELNKQQELSSCWDRRPFGHDSHGPKVGRGCCGGLGPHWVLI